jgi:hypothetical protein
LSTLSKVFVVLVLLASVAFAMTSIARLQTTENYKEKFTTEQKDKVAAEQAQQTAVAQRKDWEIKYTETKAALESTVADRDQEIVTLKASAKAAQDELTSVKTTLEAMGADVAGVKSELEKARTANEELRKAMDEAIKRSGEDREARLDAEQQLKDSQLRVKNLLDDVKDKEEQIRIWMQRATDLENMVKAYEARTGIKIGGPQPGAPVAKIDGVVTEVSRTANEVWVQLSVGSTNDVKEGTRFILFGPDAYKGDMLVTSVYPESSIGRLTSQGTKEVVKGDRATTSLE